MSQRNPEISKGVDWIMIWLYMALVTIGIISIFSVTYREEVSVVDGFFKMRADYGKQTLYFVLCLFLGMLILLTDSKFFTATANIWYAFGILLLLLVFPFHTEVKGTKSIIRFGGFQLQPAELCKLFVNLALAKYLSRIDTDFTKTRSHMIAAAIVLVPALITIAQAETGFSCYVP
jgi:rod shape determining protein RodA